MSSSAQVSSISTPFSHLTTATSPSDLSDELTFSTKPLKISRLIADFIAPLAHGTFYHGIKDHQGIENQIKERSFQLGFSKDIKKEMSELVNGFIIANNMLQTERRENGNKLKIGQTFLAKIFGLVGHKAAQNIIRASCDLIAQGVLNSKGKTSQNQLYIIYSFIMRSWPLVNAPFQSTQSFNIFELFMSLSKTPLIQEHQLWSSFIKDCAFDDQVLKSQGFKGRQVFSQNQPKESSDVEDLENHDKCSTASRSSITAHERNYEMSDIESAGNVLELGPNFSSPQKNQLQPSTPSKLVFEIYEGFFMGDLDIDFSPSDNLLSALETEGFKERSTQSYFKSGTNHYGYNYGHNNQYNNYNHPYQSLQYSQVQPVLERGSQFKPLKNNQEMIQLKLFTLPDPNFGHQSGNETFKEQTYNVSSQNENPKTKRYVHNISSSSSSYPKTKTQTKMTQNQNQKLKEKMPKTKKPEEKGFKLWDMISVNGKLKKK